jgi:dolichol-phosphate mannosyltransferase
MPVDITESLPQPTLSVVVPCFNEMQVLRLTHERLSRALQALGLAYEIIYVDDGSRDRTAELLLELTASDPCVRVLFFSRNFGHQAAVSAGLEAAAGEAVVIIDADLQDPPELIADMVARWRDGVEVVYGQRMHRKGEGAFKLASAKAFYRALNAISEVEIPLDVGDFRLLDRRVVDVMLRMPERDRFLRGMVAWVGFRQEALQYERQERAAGETKYPLRKMVALAFNGILSFSLAPLRLSVTLGLLTTFLAFSLIIYALVVRLFTAQWVEGWAMIFIGMMLLGGIQLIVLGAIGEYVGRIYMEAKGRPMYIVRGRAGYVVDRLV